MIVNIKKSRKGEVAGEVRYGGRLWVLNWTDTGKRWSGHGCLMTQRALTWTEQRVCESGCEGRVWVCGLKLGLWRELTTQETAGGDF